MDRWRRRAALLAAAWLAAAAGSSLGAARAPRPASWPIAVEEIARTLADGQPLRGWVARVDLTDPRVSFVVPGRAPRGPADPPGVEARLAPLDAWARTARAALAVNGNFFRRLPGAAAGPWTEGEPVDIIALSVSAGVVVSPPRTIPRAADPVLLVDETVGNGDAAHCPCRVEVRRGRLDLGRVDEAVSGLASADMKGAATLPVARHPRTAAGLTRDRRTLLLVVVDGRQPGWSAGATLVELGELVRGLGARTALNLDGGGSSALWSRGPDEREGRIRNRPSDGHVRPVANALGVRVSAR